MSQGVASQSAEMAATVVPMNAQAAFYFLVVKRQDVDETHVRVTNQGWIPLKGDAEEAFSRYCWGHADRAAFEAGLGDLRCLRFSLTHAGQSAVYLGHFKLNEKGWSKHPISYTWTSSVARFHGDLPLRIQALDQELWSFEEWALPSVRAMMELWDRNARRPRFQEA